MPDTEICFLTATELARRIRAKELSAREVLEAHLAQIERVNPGQRDRHAGGRAGDAAGQARRRGAGARRCGRAAARLADRA